MKFEKPKILVPLVNRTNYSKLKMILNILKNSEKVDLFTCLSSGIVIERVGSASHDLIADGISADTRIDCLLRNDSLEAMSKTCGLSIIEHSSLISRINPDMVLAVGDRFDILGPVLSAKMSNIPIFHIQGGEKSGSIDDTVRDVVSLCSNYHFVATDSAKLNVERITSSKHVYNYGCPAVEYITTIDIGDSLSTNKLHRQFHDICINSQEPYFLVAVHPNTTEENDINMNVILDAVIKFKIKTIVIYPNIDAFNYRIVQEINKRKNIFPISHLCLEDFVKVMAHAKCLIGNSSAGIREAASFGTPVVNIGNRQQLRERNKNTIDVKCNFEEIYSAIETSLSQGKYSKDNVYYKEHCTKNIVNNILNFL